MFIRQQGRHTLTNSGRCWVLVEGMESLEALKAEDENTKDENGFLIVDYVDTTDLQFAIALVDDGRTECGHILGRPLFTYIT